MLHYLAKFITNERLQNFAIFMAGILFVAFVLVMFSGVVLVPESVSEFFLKLFGVNVIQTANPKKEVLEFLGLGIGGFIALYGLAALDKRANAQSEQNKSQVEQNKLTKEGIFQEQLNAAVGHLSSESESGRIASFYEFFHLAKSREDYAQSILDLLCAHLRKITNDETKKDSQEVKFLTGGLLFRKDTMEPFSSLFFNLQGVNLSGIGVGNIYIPTGDIDLEGAILGHAELQDVDLQNANLRRAILNGADLTNADLQNADLRKAELKGANLTNADLQNANLRRAILNGADLTNADLQNANFEQAILADAILADADLRNANLKDAILMNSRALSLAKLSGAEYNGGTLFPYGFDPESKEMKKVEQKTRSQFY